MQLKAYLGERATLDLLNDLQVEFDTYPIKLNPERAYSPASIAKAYLESMGIIPPRKKFYIPSEISGIAMQAYYGGRAECRIRNTPVLIVHTDVRSEYPTVNTLLGLWSFLTAERLRFEDGTEDVRDLLANVTLDDAFDSTFWKKLTFFALLALLQPSGEILPVRTKYNEQTNNIGINPLGAETLFMNRLKQLEKDYTKAHPQECENQQTENLTSRVRSAERILGRARQMIEIPEEDKKEG